MATKLRPTRVPALGEKIIHELAGVASTGHEGLSVARITAPPGWVQPMQRPSFDEVSYVLAGELRVEDEEGSVLHVGAGEAVLCRAGQRVRYAVGEGGADYLAVCSPAFTETGAQRDPA